MSVAEVHDTRNCILGEGAFWHPIHEKLYWFDIMGRQLLCDDGRDWSFHEHVSAMGWIGGDLVLIASETGLFSFDLSDGTRTDLCQIEADDPTTRSNDGRADPHGGFWIGTMGKNAEPDAGAIYRFYKGELRRLFAPVTISNAICFSPDGVYAYFCDTRFQRVMRVVLDDQGWPAAPPVRFLDLTEEDLNPDGAIVATDGSLLNAQWGAGRVARYSNEGHFIEAFLLPTDHVTCPAFGGPELKTLFATTARQGLSAQALLSQPDAGQTFRFETTLSGQKEPQILL